MSPKRSATFKAGRRDEILAAARHCFAVHGYDRATLREIANEARLSTGAIYTYFRSKTEILDALCEEETAERQAELQRQLAALPPSGNPYTTAFAAVLQPFLTLPRAAVRERERADLLLWYEATRDPEVAASIQQHIASWHELSLALLREERAANRLDAALDLDTLAAILIALPIGLSLVDLLHGGSLNWPTAVETIGGILRGGLAGGVERAGADPGRPVAHDG